MLGSLDWGPSTEGARKLLEEAVVLVVGLRGGAEVVCLKDLLLGTGGGPFCESKHNYKIRTSLDAT